MISAKKPEEPKLDRTPITRRGSCARAGDTHAAAPPRRLMNSRRLMWSPHAEDYTLPHRLKKRLCIAAFLAAVLPQRVIHDRVEPSAGPATSALLQSLPKW